MNRLLDILLPRFVTEDIVFLQAGGSWEPVCCLTQWKEWGDHNCEAPVIVCKTRSFNFWSKPFPCWEWDEARWLHTGESAKEAVGV